MLWDRAVRTIIYTGKGGVGKTSLSSSTALASAERGHKTLVMSTDSAHSLGDSLEATLGPDPIRISENLDAQEVDILTEMERNWKDIYTYFTTFLTSQGVEEITAKEFVVLPGMDMIAALLLLESYQKGGYDVVVMDTAPTADTLRLLSFPDALRWYFDHFFRLQKRMTKVARPTVGKMMKTPLPSDDFFDAIERLYNRAQHVKDLLTDGKQTTVRLVMNPTRMVISETQRAYTYLCLFGVPIELIVVNKVYPPASGKGYFEKGLEEQEKNMATIKDTFGDMPILSSPRYPYEILGREKLLQLAKDVFDDKDPTDIRAATQPIRFYQRGKMKFLSIELPFAESEKIEVLLRGDTLYIRVGWHKRTILLPLSYAGCKLGEAKYANGKLTVQFS
jgi:arsenite-transporting ATPase